MLFIFKNLLWLKLKQTFWQDRINVTYKCLQSLCAHGATIFDLIALSFVAALRTIPSCTLLHIARWKCRVYHHSLGILIAWIIG